MTFIRAAFVMALAVLFVGFLAGRSLVGPMLSPANLPSGPALAQGPATSVATATPHATISPRPTPTAKATPAVSPTASPTPLPSATPRITPTPLPTPSPTAGVVSLDRYWVGSPAARAGSIIEIGFVIDNPTGRTERLTLGTSIKSSKALNWASSGLSDPAHDVVAIVPPGVSTHSRYFALPASLRPGSYDVAWGLRNAATGVRVALVFAATALQVRR